MVKKFWTAIFAATAGCLSGVGCVQREMTIRTDPPGALVYLNDQEIGRTPLTRNFTWYGFYDVEIRKEGYESIKTVTPVIAPWWQWVPFDFFAEAFPLTDRHELMYTLRVPNERKNETDLMINRALQLGSELESSQKPATQPTTKPKDKPKPHKKVPQTQPTTQPNTQK